MQFKFKKYSIQTQTNATLSIDIENEIKVNPKLISLILSDIIHIDKFINSTEIILSSLIISVDNDQEELVIDKDYINKRISFNSSKGTIIQNIYQYISNLLNIDFNEEILIGRILDLNKFKTDNVLELENYLYNMDSKIKKTSTEDDLKKLQLSIDQLKLKAKEGLTVEEITKLDKLREVKMKIKTIQEEVDFYQNEKKFKEEYTNKLKFLESEKTTITQMLESSKLLIEARDGLKSELIKFGPLVKDQQLILKVKALKQEKLQKMHQILVNFKAKIKNDLFEADPKPSSNVYGKFIIILLFFQVLLTILNYAFSLENKVIYIGALSFAILIFIFILINLFKPNDLIIIKTKQKAEVSNIDLFSQKDEKQSKFFINAAWVNALKDEYNLIESNIKARFNNKSYDEISNELKIVNNKIESLKLKITELATKTMNSEDYYKKRRELDILKIEKENIEYSSNKTSLDIEKDIDELNQKLTTLKSEVDINTLIPVFVLNFVLATDRMRKLLESISLKRDLIFFLSDEIN